MKPAAPGELIPAWAAAEPAIALCVLIGSHARAGDALTGADAGSDWDFQLATTAPERFADGAWLAALGLPPLAYALRPGRLGSALKATAVTARGELDIVVLPAEPLRGLARLVMGGAPPADPAARQALTDLAAVLAGGYRILKGEAEFGPFYARVAGTIPPARLGDAELRRIADGFVCDYVALRRRLARGELLAARRALHHQLADVNARLLHELRLRRGQSSFPDARRLERLDAAAAARLALPDAADAAGLRGAARVAARTCRWLLAELLGGAWRWPDLAALGLGGEELGDDVLEGHVLDRDVRDRPRAQDVL